VGRLVVAAVIVTAAALVALALALTRQWGFE
jgi:hypothetical protein